MCKARWIGLGAFMITCVLDQAHKYYMIYFYNIAQRQPVSLTSFLDLILTFNRGISYSLFSSHEAWVRWGLVGFSLCATLVLLFLMGRTPAILRALGLGLIAGGALGNALDRVIYGAVADFFYFHIGDFSWYVFNLADVAICGGAALLLLPQVVSRRAVMRLG